MKKETVVCAMLLMLCVGATAGLGQSSSVKSKVGTTAVPFLEIGVGPRAVAMGEAFTAVADDASSLYWNPAGIVALDHNEGMFAHTAWIANVQLNYAALTVGSSEWGALGLSVYTMNSGQMAVRTEERPEGTGETFAVQDMVLGVTYARRLTDKFVIGGTLKYIHSSLWQMNASTIAVDAGWQFVTPLENLTLGMSISNFGGELSLDGSNLAVRYDPDLRVKGNNDGIIADQHTRSWDLPLIFRFGTAYRVFTGEDHRLGIAADVLYPNNNANYMNVGAEYGLLNKFFLRGGFKGLFMPDREGGMSFGGGIYLAPIKVDYAYSDMGKLSSVHRFSASVTF